MATAVIAFESVPAGGGILHTPGGPVRILRIPWRDADTVAPEKMGRYISMLERACAKQPRNADFRTCLGMAHAMNHDFLRSMDALEEARRIEPENFLAQLKLAEMHYRLRALERAEAETRKALDLAGNAWELSLAWKQLAGIRHLRQEA